MSVFTQNGEWVPLPGTERGFGTQLGTHAGKGLLVYGSGRAVVVRSLEDPSKGHLFYGHNARVMVARTSPNGEWVASGDESGKVMVWGINNKIVKNEVLIGRKVNDLAWSDDGKRLVAAGDGEAKVRAFAWDSSNALGDMAGCHSEAIISCDFKPGRPYRVITGGEDNRAGFFKGPPFKFDSSFRGHTRFVNCVRYAPDGSQYVTVGADRLIAFHEGKEGEKTAEIDPKADGNHSGAIYSAAWSPDGKRLLTASADKTAKLWDVESRTVVSTFTFGSDLEDQQVAAGFVGETMVTVSLSGVINVLDPENPAVPARVIYGHSAPLTAFSADPSSGVVVSGDSAGRLVAWDRATGAASWYSNAPGKGVVAAAVLHGGERVATATDDDQLRFSECKTAEWASQSVPIGGRATAVVACPGDADLVAIAVAQGRVLVARSTGIVASVDVPYRPLSVAFRPGGAEVAVGGDDKKTHVYSVSGDALAETGAYPSLGNVGAVAYSADGTVLFSGCGSRTLLARDAANGYADLNGGHKWCFHNSAVRGVATSPSGDLVVSASGDQALTAFPDSKKYSMTHKRHLDAHIGGVDYVVVFDETSLVTAGADSVIRFWTVAV